MRTGKVLSEFCDVGDVVVQRVDGVGYVYDGEGNQRGEERVSEESDANIRLIAAAPELLEALWNPRTVDDERTVE